MMKSQMMMSRVRRTITGVSIPGNQIDLDGECSQVDLDTSVFSNVLPQNMMFDHTNKGQECLTPKGGMNGINSMNMRFQTQLDGD